MATRYITSQLGSELEISHIPILFMTAALLINTSHLVLKIEPEVPSWLNESYLATVLKGGVDQEPRVTMTSFTAKSALPLDQNYGTYVFRVKLNKRAKFEFGPKDFYCPDRNRLVLKDLNEDGYVMADRSKQLDFSHCKLVMTSIGKYHASSVSLQHENSKLVEEAGSERLYYDKGPFKKEVKG
ncbi:hypothetical protein J6590_095163 [Homalodisca vitripennis]|nr:hypothetical protein J6590_095163 [Homalodisca vitripennis]